MKPNNAPFERLGTAALCLAQNLKHLFLVSACLLSAVSATAVSSLEVNPATISNDFSGVVTLNISGLDHGQAVRCERYVDLNSNGAIETGEPLVESYTLTDGQLPRFGGVRNKNMLGDEDESADGQIRAELNLIGVGGWKPDIAANFIFRISDPQNGSTLATQYFAVRQKVEAQGITGRITIPGGAPVSNALVYLADSYNEFISGTVTDTNGNYRFHLLPGGYQIGMIKDNLMLSNSSYISINTNQLYTRNFTATNATVSVSGRVLDGTNGVGGILLSITGDPAQMGFTDISGNFKLLITPSVFWWERYVEMNAVSQIKTGYLESDSWGIPAGNGLTNVHDLVIGLTKATSLVYGQIKDDSGEPVQDIDFSISGGDGLYGTGRSYLANGEFYIGVGNGNATLTIDTRHVLLSRELWPPEYYYGSSIYTANSAFQTNIIVKRTNARLRGRVLDDAGAPVTNLFMRASSDGRSSLYDQLDRDGRFDFGIVGGTWDLAADNYPPNEGYLISTEQYEISDGEDLEVVYYVRKRNAKVIGNVRTTQDLPVTNVYVYATVTISNSVYDAYGVTDTNGNFSLSVTKGDWQLSVNLYSGPFRTVDPQTISVTGTNSVNFVLSPLPHLHLTLADNTGENISNSWIYVRNLTTENYNRFYSVYNGSVDIYNEPGEWMISLSGNLRNGLFGITTNFTMVEGSDLTAELIVPRGTNTISGYLRDPIGNPITNVNVDFSATLLSPVGSFQQSVYTDNNGQFRAQVLDGEWTLAVSSYGLASYGFYPVEARSVDVFGSSTNVDWVAQPFTNHVRGVVQDEQGKPVTNALVEISNLSTRTDSQGKFDLITQGGFTYIHFSGTDIFSGYEYVNLSTETNTENIIIVARRITGWITGTIRNESANGVKFIDITAVSTNTFSDPVLYGATDSEGKFSIPAFAGEWTLNLSCYDLTNAGYYCTPSQTVTLAGTNVVADFTVQKIPLLQITTTNLPNAIVDWPYEQTLNATGGIPPYRWSLASPESALPGFSLSTNGVLSGLPEGTGTFNFSVWVVDSYQHTNHQTLVLTVDSNPCRYRLGTNELRFGPGGGTQTILLLTSNQCPWQAERESEDFGWISFPATNGTGSGWVGISVEPRTDSLESQMPRTGFVKIAGQRITVHQEGVSAPNFLTRKKLIISTTNAGNLILLQGGNGPYKLLTAAGSVLQTGSSSFNTGFPYNWASLSLQPSNTDQSVSFDLFFASASAGHLAETLSSSAELVPFTEGSFVAAEIGPDFNGDARTDFLWQHDDGRIVSWFMKDDVATGSSRLRPEKNSGPGWRAIATADFDHDNDADILWQNANRSLAIWFMDGTNFLRSQIVAEGKPASMGWRLAALADFNYDSQDDFIWQHNNGQVAVWFMDSGTNFLQATFLRDQPVAGGWKMAGVTDFDDDSQNDILWQHDDGRLAVWYFIGSDFLRAASFAKRPSPGWRVIGIADLDLDGYDDLVWMNQKRVLAVWYMNGTNYINSALLRAGKPVEPGWRFIGPR